MAKLFKNGHHGVNEQLCSLDVQTSRPSISPNPKMVIDKNSKVFEDIPKSIPPPRDHDHVIHLILGSVPPIVNPYRGTLWLEERN